MSKNKKNEEQQRNEKYLAIVIGFFMLLAVIYVANHSSGDPIACGQYNAVTDCQ